MSHFTVLVIGDNVEEQLEPFWELDLSQEKMKEDSRAKFTVEVKAGEEEEAFQQCLLEKKDYLKKAKLHYKTWQEWMKDWHSYVFSSDHQGWGYYSNPNAKWDWYSMGGRWTGFFKLKEGQKGVLGQPGVGDNTPTFDTDQAKKGEIDWEGMKREKIYQKKQHWQKMVEKCGWDLEKTEPVDLFTAMWRFGYKIGQTPLSFVDSQSSFMTFAIIKDRKWYEHGKMGWWACVSDEKSEEIWRQEWWTLFNSASDDTLMTLVDCHI